MIKSKESLQNLQPKFAKRSRKDVFQRFLKISLAVNCLQMRFIYIKVWGLYEQDLRKMRKKAFSGTSRQPLKYKNSAEV